MAAAAGLVFLAACESTSDSGSDSGASTSATPASTTEGLDTTLFLDGALAEEPATEDCTLSDGTESTCYRITISGYPSDREAGPFCPATISDDADQGGIWFDGEDVYDLDGTFIEDLAQTYGDDGWKMYDDEGNVLVTDTQEKFEAAARPDVDPELQNHCVEGTPGVAGERRADPVDSADPGRRRWPRRPPRRRGGTTESPSTAW